MSKQVTQFGQYAIQAANTVEQIALHKKRVYFNKLWLYPASGMSAGLLTANVGDVYIGEKGDGPNVTPDILQSGDPPIKIELPQGEEKLLEEVLIQGANVGDGVWFKYWPA